MIFKLSKVSVRSLCKGSGVKSRFISAEDGLESSVSEEP